MTKKLSYRKWSKTQKVKIFSDRSGMPFDYNECVIEPGTGLLVHKTENDGKWNRAEVYKDPIVPPDAQILPHSRPIPNEGENESFFF